MSATHNPEQAMTIKQALSSAHAMGIDQLDAQLLLLFALGRTSRERAWLLAHDNDSILPDEQNQFLALMQRRAIGVPVAYLIGEKEFYGLPFTVDKRVLIPRPETELLVEWALELIDADPTKQKILDLGTGSGILAVTLKHERPALEVTAVDISEEALIVAKLNASALLPAGQQIRFLHGKWFSPLFNETEAEKFNLIISNPPYIAAEDEHLKALTNEPQNALVSGSDGLDDIRQIISEAKRHLLPESCLMLEHGYNQASAVQALMKTAGFQNIETRPDLAGVDRATTGTI